MARAKKHNHTVVIPKNNVLDSQSDKSAEPRTPKTPKTPADEGLDFFESAFKEGEPAIRVYELRLDPDGGPNKDKSVRRSCEFNITAFVHPPTRRTVYAPSSSVHALHCTRVVGSGYAC